MNKSAYTVTYHDKCGINILQQCTWCYRARKHETKDTL